MSGLSQEARALINGVSELDGPLPSDKTRIQQRLALQLGTAAFATSVLPSATTGGAAAAGASGSASVPGAAASASNGLASIAPKGFWLGGFGKALIGAAALAGVGMAWWLGAPPAQPPSVAARPAAPSAPVALATRELPAQVSATAEPAATPPASAPVPETARPSAKTTLRAKSASAEPKPAAVPSDTLRAELALLGRAQAALRAGRFQEAFALASEHRRTFPEGVMKEERMGVAALAECALSPQRGEAQAFLKQAASSPLAARVRKACELP